MPESFPAWHMLSTVWSLRIQIVLSIGHLIRALLVMITIMNYQLCFERTSGGYCGRVPPLPIPNREVKPACADGTAMQCGRVGSRLLSNTESFRIIVLRLFFLCIDIPGKKGMTGDVDLLDNL